MSRPAGRPRLRELAEILGVTPTAVSMALNGRPGVSEELRARVKALAMEHGYLPSYAARALRAQRSGMLGLISRNLKNPGYLQVIDGFTSMAEERGYQVLVGTSDLDGAREASLLSIIAARQLDGLAISPVDGRAAVETWRNNSDRPLVLLNTGRVESELAAMSIRTDSSQSLDDALEHLTGLGHYRIQLLTTRGLPSASARSNRFRRLMKASGRWGSVISGSTEANTIDSVARRLSTVQRPTAYIADSDLLAQYVYTAAATVGLRIPDELSVVGFDNLSTSSLLDPPLTTFDVDRFNMGRLAATMLLDRLNDRVVVDAHHLLPATLVVRGSTAAPSIPRELQDHT